MFKKIIYAVTLGVLSGFIYYHIMGSELVIEASGEIKMELNFQERVIEASLFAIFFGSLILISSSIIAWVRIKNHNLPDK